jgi:RsiW-degrading membrane proteinase PrsW (M82 family)
MSIDYITFEPFDHYAGKLRELRIHHEPSFWKHVAAMSLLSHKLLHVLGCSLVVLAILALLRVDNNFTLAHLLVVLATLFQAFFILHFVHWRWNRFDLSLDAVIKFFSSGFVLCTGIAVLMELILSVLFGILRNVIVVVIAIAEQDTAELPTASADSIREFTKEFQHDHLWLFGIFTFLNAFVVAALIEEVSKYFGFFMVEHPDLEEGQTRQSRGAGITVAMVSTALGFACCENLLYVFVYTPPSIANEVATLVARSIFPVHPLAAAIQSIGVCRRDLEGNRSYQLGRIILPALVLHGSFDFVLMLMALLQSVEEDEHDSQDPTHGINEEVPALISSVVIVLVGLIYYICQAEAQRLRLHELDQGLQSGEGTGLLV